MSERPKVPRRPRQHGPAQFVPGEKAQDFKGTMKKLLAYLSDYKLSMLVVLVFAVASTVFAIVSPKILGQATTVLFEGVMAQIAGTGGIDFGAVKRILIILGGLYLFSSLFGYIQEWIMSGVSMKVSYRLRRDIIEKINRMPFGYFDKTTHGEVLSRVTNDVDTLSQSLNQSLNQIITSVVTVVGVLVMMVMISWQMTLIALLTVPLSMVVVMLIVKRSQKYFKLQQDFLGNVNGHVEEMYGGHLVIKAFNREQKSIARFDELNDRLYGAAWKAQFLTSIIMPLMNFVGNLGYVAVSIAGGYFAVQRVITVGDIQAFIQYVRQFTQPIAQIANISNILQQTAAAAERIFEFLAEKEMTPDPVRPVWLKNIRGEVEFRHVSFGYTPDKLVIKDFNAVIKAGQKVAIVGPTGAGKTTIVKLLMRFYDIDSGEILIDGQNIKDMRREDLRSLFGMVLQETWLYNGTIMENIRYGRLDATDEEVVAAAKAAYVDSFVHALPGGYQMVLNEEASNISQGQKQLITIARAILADPKILILDEATSSVDTRTEIRIQKALNRLMKNRTSFIIAHRLSTIRDADLILVMKDGDIVEQGTHDQLLRQGGFYRELYLSQFEPVKTG